MAVKHQISAEIRSLPDLCQSLDNLDVSISFLKSVGGDPEHNLHGFMSETLKMENPLLSQKVGDLLFNPFKLNRISYPHQ